MLWCSVGALSLAGCTALIGRKPAAQPAPQGADTPPNEENAANGQEADLEEQSNDPETGVKHLNQLLRRFNAALQARNFKEAENILKRAELGLERASSITRSHPDFEDVAEQVKNSRPRFDAAVEQDRVERRNAAIDDLIRRGELAMQQANTILLELNSRPPQSTDLEHLNESLEAFASLQKTGEDFIAEQRYKTHAEGRDALAQKVEKAQARANRELGAQAAVAPAIEAGIVAANRAKNSQNPQEQLAAYREVVQSFANCVAAVQQAATQPGFDPKMVLQTRLGNLTAEATQNACAATSRQATERVNRFAWESGVHTQIDALTPVMAAIRNAKSARDAEVASTAAVTQLRTCEDNSAIVSKQPGFDPKYAFETPFGKLTSPQLVQRCGSEAQKLTADAPGLHWRTLAETVPPQLADYKGRIDTASKTADPARAADAWSAALGGLQECIARGKDLMANTGASKQVSFSTVWGSLTMPAIVQTCSEERGKAEKSMAKALASSQLQTFVASCHADEVEVVRREGMPSRIEVVPQGRLFVYSNKRFGFNKDGQRVDFSLQWKTVVQNVIDQLAALLPAARGNGKAAEDAITQLTPVLESCQNGSVIERHPGFDESAVFATPFGQVHAVELRKACTNEAGKLRTRQTALAWQVRAEALRDRSNDAAKQQGAAAEKTNPTDQVTLLGGALGGFTECAERAEALSHSSNADRKYKISGVLGNMSVAELGRACEKQRVATQKKTRCGSECPAVAAVSSLVSRRRTGGGAALRNANSHRAAGYRARLRVWQQALCFRRKRASYRRKTIAQSR